jgi:NTP pyrophosphatase (non-canonical NTP hydrolase)
MSKVSGLNEYQSLALITMSDETDAPVLALGLAGESGEVCDHFKKMLDHGHPLDRDRVAFKLGDIMRYVACMAEHLGFTLEQIATDNIEKLKRRYPEGFDIQRSINREG